MNRKLIFLDIDGTLTQPGCNVPPESALEVIREAQALGHRVFLCTGRNYDMLRPLLSYGFDGAVASGGGYVFCGDQVLFDCPMTEEQKERALRLFAEGGVLRTIEARDASWCDEGMGEFLRQSSGGNSELLRWREALEKDLGIRPMREYDGRPIYKVVFMCSEVSQLAQAIESLEQEFYFLVQDMAGADCLNVRQGSRHPPGVRGAGRPAGGHDRLRRQHERSGDDRDRGRQRLHGKRLPRPQEEERSRLSLRSGGRSRLGFPEAGFGQSAQKRGLIF